MDPIKDILQQVVKNLSEQKPRKEEDLQGLWEQVVGKKAAQHTHIFGIKNGRLLIFTDSPVRLFDLSLQKIKILKQMQEKIPEITEMSFKIGKVK
ncbi:MAG: DUF721 domain-containing protein [Candidatus Omnitrophica bacterium]|nr:DUF721 domain-containing protein [Candidatus Omnitrophota bacterium]